MNQFRHERYSGEYARYRHHLGSVLIVPRSKFKLTLEEAQASAYSFRHITSFHFYLIINTTSQSNVVPKGSQPFGTAARHTYFRTNGRKIL